MPCQGAASPPPAALPSPRAVADVLASRLPTIDLRLAGATAAILMIVAVRPSPIVYAHVNGFTVLGAELPGSSTPGRGRDPGLLTPTRSSCLDWAQGVTDLATSVHHYAYMVGEYVGGARLLSAPLDFEPEAQQVCRSPSERRGLLRTGATFVWCLLAALAGTPSADAAARALATTAAYAGPVRHLADFAAEDGEAPMTFRFGRSPATSVAAPLALGAAVSNAWVAVAEGLRSGRQLADALAAVEVEYDLDGWRDLIRPLDAEDIPPELLDSLVDYSDPRLGVALLAPVYQPISTPWLPLPPVQGPAPPGAPACIDSAMDMLLEPCLSDVGRWLDDTLSDLTHIRDELRNGAEPASIERRRPRALAIGQGCLHDWARGVVWDCRSRCCVPLNFHAPLETHLNLDFLRQNLADYPDRHLVANLMDGVRLEADVELHTVLVPHLTSLSMGFESVENELRRLHSLAEGGRRWYEFFSGFPFWPMYLNGQGSTAKKDTDVWRRTTEGGGPRQEVFDETGLRALSINEASHMPHVPSHFADDQRPEFQAWLRERGAPAGPSPRTVGLSSQRAADVQVAQRSQTDGPDGPEGLGHIPTRRRLPRLSHLHIR